MAPCHTAVVPLLGPHDALPYRPARVLVAGPSGSGKTTLAARIGVLLDLPHTEIDGLFHGPGWTRISTFEEDVDRFTSEPRWVTEWQYSSVRALLAARADLLVWLAIPRHAVMRQVVRRTVARRMRREELWNGNVEPPLWTIFNDRENIIRWAWSTYGLWAERVAELDAQRPELPIVRLDSHAEAEAWLANVIPDSTRGS